MNRRCLMRLLVVILPTLSRVYGVGAQHTSAGELVWAMHVTIAPAWFDPAENGGLITPFGILYALHDGVVRHMPGKKVGNSLAESWTESPDGLVYEFRLRPGPIFASFKDGKNHEPHTFRR